MENNNMNMQEGKLPNAMSAFIMGVVSLVTCGFVIPGIIFGIIARRKAAKDYPLFEADPVTYKKEEWKLKLGKILGLVGILLSVLYILFWVVWGAFMANL